MESFFPDRTRKELKFKFFRWEPLTSLDVFSFFFIQHFINTEKKINTPSWSRELLIPQFLWVSIFDYKRFIAQVSVFLLFILSTELDQFEVKFGEKLETDKLKSNELLDDT